MTTYNTSSTIFYDIANVVCFLISIYAMFALSYYYVTNDTYYMMLSIYFILFQLSSDIFLWHSNDSVLHHFFVILFGTFIFYYDMKLDEYLFLLIPLLSTEISTLFLTLKLWMEQFKLTHTMWFTINNALFASSFAVLRVYCYISYVIANPQTYSMFSKYTGDSIIAKFHIYTGLIGLFALNIYWFTIMVKLIAKPLKNISINFFSQFFLIFGQAFNIGISFYVYGTTFNWDYIGTLLVFSTSYLLHCSIFQNIDASNDPTLYIMNHLAYQIKSLFFVFSNIGMMMGHVSILYHLFFITLALYLILLSTHTIYFTGRDILLWSLIPLCFVLEYSYNFFFLVLYILILIAFYNYPLFCITEKEALIIPIALDTLQVIYFTNDFYLKVGFAILSYVLLVIFYVKPWYQHNLVLLYLVSFGHTFVLCKINS